MDEAKKLTEELKTSIERVQGLVRAERSRMAAHDRGCDLERSEPHDTPHTGGSGQTFR